MSLVPSCATHQAPQHRLETRARRGSFWEGFSGRVLQFVTRPGQDTGGCQGTVLCDITEFTQDIIY